MPPVFTNPDAKEYYEKAVACESGTQWLEAIANYELAVAAEPVHPEVWFRLGRLVAWHQSADGCGCRGYRAAMECEAQSADALFWRARATEAHSGCVFEYGDFKDSVLADYAAAIALDPTNATYYFHRAQFYYQGDHFGEALADYNAALAQQPKNPAYRFARGLLYQRHDHLPEALADYDACLALEQPAANGAVFPMMEFYCRHVETYSLQETRGSLLLLAHDFAGALNCFGLKKGTRFNWWAIDLLIDYPAPDQPAPATRLETAIRALEASGLIAATHPRYLEDRCAYFLHKSRYDESAALRALADADALLAREPNRYAYRELRVECLLALKTPNPAALAQDYSWLAAQPLPAAKALKHLGDEARLQAHLKPVEYRHKNAWAHFKLQNTAVALASFASAAALAFDAQYDKNIALTQDLKNYWSFLPPLPDEDYLLWQIRQQLPLNQSDIGSKNHVLNWIRAAASELPLEMAAVLKPALEQYQRVYLAAGCYFVQPRTAEDYAQAVALCEAGARQVPAIADIFALMRLNILKGQLREALNQPAATPASRQAALAHYDAVRTGLQSPPE